MKILAIETSCDETAAAVLDASIPRGFSRVLSNCVSSQMKLHQPYFGVVPELASRAHLEKIPWVVGRALKKSGVQRCDAVAYTRGPGLAGALLVGKVAAETLAFMWRVPLIPVHHLEGHALALGLTEPIRFPFLALIVSGGHTDLVLMSDYGRVRVLGRTRDDAAGEAFDKVAKLLRLGYPGGPLIDRLAREGNPEAIQFPRALLKGSWDFSFSGLKTSVLYYLMDRSSELRVKSSEVVNLKSSTLNSQLLTPNSFVKDVCASFQEAVVDTLIQKTLDACLAFGIKRVVVGGGVAANTRLRRKFFAAAPKSSVQVSFVQPVYCTDNAAMIAQVAFCQLRERRFVKGFAVEPSLAFQNWR